MLKSELVGKAQHRELTMEVRPNAHERAKYGRRWRDPIGQLECGLEVLMGWQHKRVHMSILECSNMHADRIYAVYFI